MDEAERIGGCPKVVSGHSRRRSIYRYGSYGIPGSSLANLGVTSGFYRFATVVVTDTASLKKAV
jgi:hypothetical protein